MCVRQLNRIKFDVINNIWFNSLHPDNSLNKNINEEKLVPFDEFIGKLHFSMTFCFIVGGLLYFYFFTEITASNQMLVFYINILF